MSAEQTPVEWKPVRDAVALIGVLLVGCAAPPTLDVDAFDANYEAVPHVELNDNGAWSWFSSERAIVHDDTLIVGSVRSVGPYEAASALAGWGDVEVATYDFESGEVGTVILHERLQQDDHNNPALLPTDDGRILAVYTKHAIEQTVYFNRSAPGDALSWGEPGTFESPGGTFSKYATYANLFRWPGGRIYNFYRGYHSDPNYMFSDDDGRTWSYGGRVLRGRDGHSPYLRYAYDGAGRLHFIVTEDHPGAYDTGIFHGYLEDGLVHRSDGEVVARLSTSTAANLSSWDLTSVHAGTPIEVAWTVDIELDGDKPTIVYSVQTDGYGRPGGAGGFDTRYHYGRWTGDAWETEEFAFAGERLYPGQDDYTGLVALDPNDRDIVYISTNANPLTGAPLVSKADGLRHYELFRGERRRSSGYWDWEPITLHSDVDNLRPIVPKWDDERTALVWMRGAYIRYTEWTSSVALMVLP